jgi:hypothetical protein
MATIALTLGSIFTLVFFTSADKLGLLSRGNEPIEQGEAS